MLEGEEVRRLYTAVIVAAGVGHRTGITLHKALIPVLGIPLWRHSLEVFLSDPDCEEALVVAHPDDIETMRRQVKPGERVRIIEGSTTRFGSSARGIAEAHTDIVLVHDAARPLLSLSSVKQVSRTASRIPCYLARPLTSLIRDYRSREISEPLLEVMTPQGFRRDLWQNAIVGMSESDDIRDEMTVFRSHGLPVMPIITSEDSMKVTTRADLRKVERLLTGDLRFGTAYDIHRLAPARPLVLGGVAIPSACGPVATSDGDIVYHVIAEAIISGLRLGDLGTLFPESDPANQGASSDRFVKEMGDRLASSDGRICSLEVDLFFEEVSIRPYKAEMVQNIARLLGIDGAVINLKAHHGEGIGPVGRREAIEAKALMIINMRKENRQS